MSRTIDAQQSPLRRRGELVRIDLIKLTTYTDRALDVVDKAFYFSRDPVVFDYGNTGTDIEFWPVLRTVGPLDYSINHLPSQDDSTLMRKFLSFTLNNIDWQGSESLFLVLSNHILENARIEWTQLLLADRPTTARIDLTSLVGDEHTFWYRGRVTRVGPITIDSISFACETDIPNPVVLKALDQTKNDPKDFGRRLPDVYGKAKRVKAVGYEVGWVTTLAEDITSGFTGAADFTDLSGIEGSGNLIRIGNEEVLVTFVSNTSGNITARAQNSTDAIAHKSSEVAVELISSSVFVVAGHEVDAIQNVYVRNPFNGELTLIPSGFTKATANTGTISGETVATVTFTTAQYRTLIELLAAAAVSQPVISGGGGTEIFTVDAEATQLSIFTHTNSNTDAFLTGGLPRIGSAGIGDFDYIQAKWPVGAGFDSTHPVFRWRVKATYDAISGDSSGDPDIRMRWQAISIFGRTSLEIQVDKAGHDNLEVGTGKVGPWRTPASQFFLSDLEGANDAIKLEMLEINPGLGWGGFTQAVFYKFIGIQAELELDIGAPTLTGDVEFLSSNMGFGLELWADVDGHLAPTVTPSYKAGDGNLLEKPCDVMRHMIEGDQGGHVKANAMKLEEMGGVGGDDPGELSTYVTDDEYTPSANVLVLAFVLHGKLETVGTIPTATGNGLTWTVVDSIPVIGDGLRFTWTLFRASGSAPTTGVLTVDFAGQVQDSCAIGVCEIRGADVTTNDGVVQSAEIQADSVDHQTVTLSAFAHPQNACVGGWGVRAGFGDHTADDDLLEIFLGLHKTIDDLGAFFQPTENTTPTTHDHPKGNTSWGSIAIEVQTLEAPVQAEIDFDSYDDCDTNLGTNVLAFDSRTLGVTWEQKLSRVAFESRANLVVEEFASGTKWKMLTANSNFFWGSPTSFLTEWAHGGFVEAGQDARFVHASRFTFPYAPDWSLGSDESAFTQLVIANEDTNDLEGETVNKTQLATAAREIGAFEAAPISFKCIQDKLTAEEIAGYYVVKRIQVPVQLFAVAGVTWWEGYDLEVGDILRVKPPWDAGGFNVTCRILEYIKNNETEQIELRLIKS